MTAAPVPGSYWVVPGRLLAGAYPGASSDAEAREKIRLLRDAGVTFPLDLTEEGEYGLLPYSAVLAEGMRAVRKGVRDFSCPSDDEIVEILDVIDGELERGSVVYVHCYGGIGRTGTIVGCYLVRHGRSGEEALDFIGEQRAGTPDGGRRSPETDEQRDKVLGWSPGR